MGNAGNGIFNVFAQVSTADAGLKAFQAAVDVLKKHEVLIGVPEDASGREDKKGTPVSNAELLFIHTNGSPANSIPARPVLEPAIAHDRERVSEMLGGAIKAAADCNGHGVIPALRKAGIYGENIAKAWFTNPANGWAPNTEGTIKRKGSDAPLIDTGEMRKSITHVVREV